MVKGVFDRRQEPRISTRNLVSVAEYNVLGFETNMALGRTLDLSHDGMRLELNHPLPLNDTVCISFALGNQVIEVHGQVRYVHEVDDDTCAMGIQFLDLSDEEYEALHDYLLLRDDVSVVSESGGNGGAANSEGDAEPLGS